MKAVFGEAKEQTFTLGATFAGRMWAALERFMFLFPAILIGASIFYLPDYLGEYQQEEPWGGFLGAAMLITAGFISLVAAVLRLFRNDLWVVDVGEGMLIYQASRVLRRGYEQTGIDFGDIDRFVVEMRGSPRESRIIVQFGDDSGQRMVETRFGASSLGQAAEALGEFLDRHDLDIPVRWAD